MSKLWGGRFDKASNALADKFTFSISYDQKLAKYDVKGSIAHANMLGACGIISKSSASQIVSGLKQIASQIDDGTFKFNKKAEDIHTDIQAKLKEIIGPPADKLHTARSRNDQVVLDVKMYCMDHLSATADFINELQKSIVQFAENNIGVIIPAYTHLQAAQVVLLAHHMLAYVEMLDRDKTRLLDAKQRTDVMPLGSCALSGTSLATNRRMITKQLGFNHVSHNSIDAVSDRDFIIEAISSLAIIGMHLSRMCEDLITWVTQEFNYITIDSAFCTGSSIMPHKKNPDVLELIRGESAKLNGHVTEILTLTKGLPLTYNRDLQLDKPPLFESFERTQDMLALMAKIFENIQVNHDVLKERIKDESFFTVDMMEYLIKKGVSYRDAHDTIGTIVKDCLDQGISIRKLKRDELKKYSKHLDVDVKKLLNPSTSVKIKKSIGSTHPSLVKQRIRRWRRMLR